MIGQPCHRVRHISLSLSYFPKKRNVRRGSPIIFSGFFLEITVTPFVLARPIVDTNHRTLRRAVRVPGRFRRKRARRVGQARRETHRAVSRFSFTDPAAVTFVGRLSFRSARLRRYVVCPEADRYSRDIPRTDANINGTSVKTRCRTVIWARCASLLALRRPCRGFDEYRDYF